MYMGRKKLLGDGHIKSRNCSSMNVLMLGVSFFWQGIICSPASKGIQQHQNLQKMDGLRGRINRPHMILYSSKTGIQVTEP